MKGNTAKQILDIAQELVRQRGYSAFSYADISEQIGIRKASIHYHFASKDELVKALVKRYREAFGRKRQAILQTADSPEQQLLQFASLYGDGLQHGQICLCGMLSADFAVLPEPVLDEVKLFFAENESWLAEVFNRACATGLLHCQSSLEDEARRFLATLQGAQLIARVSDNSSAAFDQILRPLLASVGYRG